VRGVSPRSASVIPGTFVTAIEPNGHVCEDRFDGVITRLAHDDPVVLAMGRHADEALARARK
jgi:hypothetical protein